jgi:hypothetical protein
MFMDFTSFLIGRIHYENYSTSPDAETSQRPPAQDLATENSKPGAHLQRLPRMRVETGACTFSPGRVLSFPQACWDDR